MSKKTLIIVIISIFVIAIIWFTIFSRNGSDSDSINKAVLKEVGLVSIKDLQEKGSPLPLIGEVRSENEVTIKTEASGKIVGVYASIGDFVQAGRIIAEIENSSQRASVISAEAALAKTQQGSRAEQISILELRLKQANDLLNESKQSTIDTLRSVFASADDAVRNKIDQFFSNPSNTDPRLSFVTKDSQLKINIEFERFSIGKMLDLWSGKLNLTTAESDLFSLFEEAKQNMMQIRDFLDDIALAVNSLTPNTNLSQTTIDTWKGAVITARTGINTSFVSLSSAKDNLNNKITSYDIAKKQQEEGLAGGREEDILVARATLKQAQTGLEKTIIRSPISGTINDINVERGDFVSMFETVAIVSNKRALEVVAFITEDDRRAVSVGSKAIISDKFSGVISEVAPTVDKKTKKIEIKIAITDSKADFIEGESVELEIERYFIASDNTNEIIIPVSALNITTDGMFVFTVDNILLDGSEQNKLVAHPVSVGSIVGDGVIILSGITSDMNIVLDARGLKDGQEVTVKDII